MNVRMKGNYTGLVNWVAAESECITNKTQAEVYLNLPSAEDVKQEDVIPTEEMEQIPLGITNDEGIITLSSVEEISVSESESEETEVVQTATPAVTKTPPSVIGM